MTKNAIAISRALLCSDLFLD